jgi:cysteine synthase
VCPARVQRACDDPAAMMVHRSILDRIGSTSMVALRRLAPSNGTRILLKLESENPTGSMKDRMALAMIEAAERDGRLPPGGAVVEYTGGSTGVSLSLICAVKGHPLHVVSSDAFAREKLDHMAILGARLTVIASDNGQMTAELTKDMIEAARTIAAETGAYWTNQLSNPDQIPGYHPMGEEIWRQTEGHVDAYVQSVGSSGSLQGTAQVLRRYNPKLGVIAVEPAESAVLSGGSSGAHKIDGIGAGFVVPLWDATVPNGFEAVSTDEANAMALRLAREEGLFAGSSTGANVVAALRVAETLPSGSTLVTVMCDTGMKYLKLFGGS